MRNRLLTTLILFISIIIFMPLNSCSQTSDSLKSKKDPKQKAILDSPEFKEYFKIMYSLSNENTQEDLNYVNKFMAKHKLWKEMRKDQCGLLGNEKIKSDKRVLEYWTVRCNFNKLQKKVMKKFRLTYDSLGVITQKAVLEKQNNPVLPEQN
jgi:hypothetical protein